MVGRKESPKMAECGMKEGAWTRQLWAGEDGGAHSWQQCSTGLTVCQEDPTWLVRKLLPQKFRKLQSLENYRDLGALPTRISNRWPLNRVDTPPTPWTPRNTPDTRLRSKTVKMVVVNYLLFESAVGFSLFEVVHQADTVGLELPEVKDAMKSLDKFGKMIQLRSFNPWT
jgi:hypothetical protein